MTHSEQSALPNAHLLNRGRRRRRSAHPPKPKRFRVASRASLKRLGILFLLIVLSLVYGYYSMIIMPGRSHRGPLPALTAEESALREELESHVRIFADATGGVLRVGNRSIFYPARLDAAVGYIKDQLAAAGFAPHEIVEHPIPGCPAPNIEVTIPGAPASERASEIVVVGAHYDCFMGTPGADDNASGVAACLHYATHYRALAAAGKPPSRTLRILFFMNEEPPAFWTSDMGSLVYARACKARGDDIRAMISMESIGYFSSKPGSQTYPSPLNHLYPDTGDFIAFVSNYSSRALNKRALRVFRDTTPFPSEGGSPPGWLPGVGWSDQWSFWQCGYPGIMVTDTATFRNPYYHTPLDTPEKLDYDRMTRVTAGVRRVIDDLAR